MARLAFSIACRQLVHLCSYLDVAFNCDLSWTVRLAHFRLSTYQLLSLSNSLICLLPLPPYLPSPQLYEHPQNVFLARILETNLLITQIGRQAATAAAAATVGATASASAGGEATALTAAALEDTGATVRRSAMAWLQLQYHVNSFLDSSLGG